MEFNNMEETMEFICWNMEQQAGKRRGEMHLSSGLDFDPYDLITNYAETRKMFILMKKNIKYKKSRKSITIQRIYETWKN